MKLNKGFTLIELLIVIAILAALAVVVVTAINPIQNLARTRDSGRLSTVAQLGHALEAYQTNNSGVFVPEAGCSGGWITCLVNSGDINVAPAVVTNGIASPQGGAYTACGDVATAALIQNGWCYDATAAAGTAPVVVYSRLESQANTSKCTGTQAAWAVYSSADGKAGVVCTASGTAEPAPGTQTFAP